ncbi:hypothetical protein AB0F25_31010 [Streptomyces wedmorensis]|uniref:hypothetical protein n=1 Tax=Streptomyces wedmorensis TaxID=43759 RepID=UPI00344938B0
MRESARELTAARRPIGAPDVDKLLHERGFGLQHTGKTRAGSEVPYRDAQFGAPTLTAYSGVNSAGSHLFKKGLTVSADDSRTVALRGAGGFPDSSRGSRP